MYQSIYRKYRPQTFNEIYGQDAISQTLTNAIIYERVAHAYLFSGPRGTGKTSTAKLLAKALNCTNIVDGKICDECENCLMIKNNSHPDVVEIDAASNNGVDEVRDLIEKVKYAPIKGRKKVYIIDEVHMMSQGAFNALLKTLEEPPEHVVFILATTEQHKVLPTIKSRCQKFNFKKISEKDIVACLENIIIQEKCDYETKALNVIASLCDGGMRDALSLLEQVMIYSNNNITVRAVVEALDLVEDEKIEELYQLLINKDLQQTLSYIDKLGQGSVDYKQIMNEIVKKAMANLTNIKSNDYQDKQQYYLLNMIEVFDESLDKIRFDNSKKLYLDLAIIKTINFNKKTKVTSEEVLVSFNETIEPENIVSYTDNQSEAPITKTEDEEIVLESLVNNFEEPEHQEDEPEQETVAQVMDGQISFLEEDNIENTNVIDEDELMNILVQASRDELNKVKDRWTSLENYLMNINTKKEAGLLIESIPVAASADGFIVVCQQKVEVTLINSTSNIERISSFIGEMMKEKKYCFAITREDWIALKEKYLKLRQVNKLPKAKAILENVALKSVEITEIIEEDTEENELLAFGKKIFEDKLIIKKDE